MVGRDGQRRYAPSPLCSDRLDRGPWWKSCEIVDGVYCCFAYDIDIQRPPLGPIVILVARQVWSVHMAAKSASLTSGIADLSLGGIDITKGADHHEAFLPSSQQEHTCNQISLALAIHH